MSKPQSKDDGDHADAVYHVMNSLITTANAGDRFHLLDDPSVPKPDIDIPINLLFRESNFIEVDPEAYMSMEQALRLASLFLEYDSVLEWFVTPLLGNPRQKFERRNLVKEVRRAIECLSHSVTFHFLDKKSDPGTGKPYAFYAQTTLDNTWQPAHKHNCTPIFLRKHGAIRIDVRIQYYEYINKNYSSSSSCDNLRHDFMLAVALVHEAAHALGAMRRNNLRECHLRSDHSEAPEFGYAWEHFMFGGVINPFDRLKARTSTLMLKKWTHRKLAYECGGREWAGVPMSYIGQWFQKKTWKIIAGHGPGAIPPPTFHLKLREGDAPYRRFEIHTESSEALDEIRALQAQTRVKYARNMAEAGKYPGDFWRLIHAKLVTSNLEKLQRWSTPVHQQTDEREPSDCFTVSALPMEKRIDPLIWLPDDTPLAPGPNVAVQDVRPDISLKRRRALEDAPDSSTEAVPSASSRPKKRTKT